MKEGKNKAQCVDAREAARQAWEDAAMVAAAATRLAAERKRAWEVAEVGRVAAENAVKKAWRVYESSKK